MGIKRRDFIKGCAAAGTLWVPGMALAAHLANANTAQTDVVDPRIEKSIQASFGGSFSVQTYNQSAGLTYANIQHLGMGYQVVSADLLSWKVVSVL